MFGEYKNILVPVDGSEQSNHSFRKAVAIAQRNHAKLQMVHVTDTRNVSLTPEFSSLSGPISTEGLDYTFLDDLESYARDAGIEVERTVTNGNPMTLIAEAFPEEFGSDLIVIGATGKGAITRALVGSVSNYVVKNAKVDVLVVR